MKKTISAETFVQIWQTSDSLKEVCERTGTHETAANSRARNFRKRGVGLKALPSQRKPQIDYKGLAKLAEALTKGDK